MLNNELIVLNVMTQTPHTHKKVLKSILYIWDIKTIIMLTWVMYSVSIKEVMEGF